ncbi:hypothetical protein OF83DRAFT_1150523 [Amylostereum chailletii]|nr:hypothetical protein OF83DRAFT_1150523 [Amylostereum chailletii]
MDLSDAPMDLKLANAMFGKTVTEKPFEVAALFRELHQATSPKRVLLSLELFKTLTMKPPVQQWKAFTSSGLHDVYMDIATDEGIYEDDDVQKRYLLQEQTSWAKYYRDAVSKSTFIFCNVYWNMKTVPHILDSRLGHVALYCWQYNPKWDEDDASLDALNILADGASSEDRDALVKEAVIETFGAQNFVERMHRELKTPEVIDHKLANRLHFMYHFAHHPVAKRMLAALNIHIPILDAVKRQKLKGNPELEWDVLRWVAPQIYWIMTMESFILPDLIEKLNFIPVMARGAFLGATKANTIDDLEDWITLQKLIGGVVEPMKHVQGLVIVGALKKALQRVFYPTLKDMRASKRGKGLTKVRDEMIRTWVKFGKDVGLDEDLERHRVETGVKERKEIEPSPKPVHCHWRECFYHRIEPSQPTSLCSGCGKVEYCNTACQTRDWKEGGHKKECKILRAKT